MSKAKGANLLELDFPEIVILNINNTPKQFPGQWLSKYLLFKMLRKELLSKINQAQHEEKFLSSLIKFIDALALYDIGGKRKHDLCNEVFVTFEKKIYHEINSYEKINKPKIILALIRDISFLKCRPMVNRLEEALYFRLAVLISQARINVNFLGEKASAIFKIESDLLEYLDPIYIEMINKFQITQAA